MSGSADDGYVFETDGLNRIDSITRSGTLATNWEMLNDEGQ
jgi:hypothetical protein